MWTGSPRRVPSSARADRRRNRCRPARSRRDRSRRFGFGLADEVVVEVGPIPVRVADVIVRARCHQQLPRMLAIVRERLAEAVEVEREPALEAAADIRARSLPRAPFREHADLRQVVAVGELLDQQVGQRRRRFADGEARMASALDQHDAFSRAPQAQRHQRPGESGADDGDVRSEHVSAWPPPIGSQQECSLRLPLTRTTGGSALLQVLGRRHVESRQFTCEKRRSQRSIRSGATAAN